MENHKPYYEKSSRYTIDYLIRSPETSRAIERAETEVNSYLDYLEPASSINPNDFMEDRAIEINKYLSTSYEENCSVIGKAYFGDEDEIYSDENSIHAEESNSGLVALKGLDFFGFEFMQIPGTKDFKAMLMFVEPLGDLADENDEDSKEIEAYYFLPEDIISISSDEHVDTEAFNLVLAMHTSRSEKALELLEMLEPDQQYKTLQNLAYEAAGDVMPIYGDDEVHVDADIFYRIEYSEDFKASVTRVDNRGKGDHEKTAEWPLGIVQGCSFIETVISQQGDKGFQKIDELIESEPCVVLNDDNLVPIYLIPLSQFKDVMVIDSGRQ